MPFRSKSQWRACFAQRARGQSDWDCEEFAKGVDYSKLPEFANEGSRKSRKSSRKSSRKGSRKSRTGSRSMKRKSSRRRSSRRRSTKSRR